jgi:hypothetical protein
LILGSGYLILDIFLIKTLRLFFLTLRC